MKFILSLLCLALCAVPTGIHAAEAAKPAAKKPAKKAVDPKKAAEDARYKGISSQYREAAKMMEEDYDDLMDAFVEFRDLIENGQGLDLIWGSDARRDAEEQKEDLAEDLADLSEEFEEERIDAEKKIARVAKKLREEATELGERPKTSSEKLNAMMDKEYQKARDELAIYDNMLFAIAEMEKCITSARKSTSRVADRLTQVGIGRHDAPKEFRTSNSPYEKIIEQAFEVKDLKADIEMLEAKKAKDEEWNYRDDAELERAQRDLNDEGMRLEKLVERELVGVTRDIEKLEHEVKRYEERLERMSHGSSYDRYEKKKWDVEAEMYQAKAIETTLKKVADWKPKPKGKQKAGH